MKRCKLEFSRKWRELYYSFVQLAFSRKEDDGINAASRIIAHRVQANRVTEGLAELQLTSHTSENSRQRGRVSRD